MSELEFWQAVYVAAVRAGTPSSAADIADRALHNLRSRRPNLDEVRP